MGRFLESALHRRSGDGGMIRSIPQGHGPTEAGHPVHLRSRGSERWRPTRYADASVSTPPQGSGRCLGGSSGRAA